MGSFAALQTEFVACTLTSYFGVASSSKKSRSKEKGAIDESDVEKVCFSSQAFFSQAWMDTSQKILWRT